MFLTHGALQGNELSIKSFINLPTLFIIFIFGN